MNRTRHKSPYYISPAREERELKRINPTLKTHMLIGGKVKCNTVNRAHKELKTTEVEAEVECHYCKKILEWRNH